MTILTLLTALAGLASASPIKRNNDGRPPTVTIKDGTLTGVDQPQFGQELFLGIPYAQSPPPRLAKSQPVQPYGELQATKYGPSCYSRFTTGFDDNSGFESSEDCLSLNVVRPYGVFEGQDPVPVLVWIHGGGLTTGGSQDYRYNSTALVQASVDNGSPVVFVSINYRLASLGFLAGSQLRDNGLLNLGFLDQRLALQWVQDNIGKFGGDPSKVTIQGESAGGRSVHAHILAYGGRDDGLFSQGVIQSGGPSGKYEDPSPANFQSTYDALISNTTCSSTANASFDEQVDCIRGLDIDTYRRVTASGSTGTVRDGSFVKGESAFTAYSSGKYVKVPMLVGANTDEGVSFGSFGANTTEEVVETFTSSTVSEDVARGLAQVYPEDPVLGSPYDTGSYQLDPYQAGGYVKPGRLNKQIAAITGDLRQIGGPRWLAKTISDEVPFYKYQFNHVPYTTTYGVQDYVGHFLEVSYVFNLQNNNTEFWLENRFTATYLGEGAPVTDRGLGQYMSRSFAAFAACGDPNKAKFTSAPYWPKYSEGHEQITFRAKGSTVDKDDYRKEGIQYIVDNIFLA